MRELPRVKVEDINLDVVTEKALITTIDVFRFIHEENSYYVKVEIENGEGYDFLDEIEISNLIISVKTLEMIALNWIFRHVELFEVN